MKVLIYGLGRSGLAAARLCISQGHEVDFYDQRSAGPDIDALKGLGGKMVAKAVDSDARVCIAAPGVPIDHPDLEELRRSGSEVVGEVEWVYRTVAARIVGVTGTAGKGTVTRWIADTLAESGVDARAGGNIDPALSEVAAPGATLIAELSSFQLERCPTFRPRVAVVLNLGSDHLDRHGDVATYHGSKRNLIRNLTGGELFVYNTDDPVVRSWASGSSARVAGFSLAGRADAWLDPGGVLHLGSEELLHQSELRVRGRHHVANALAVALACRELGLSVEQIRAGLTSFEGLPGRYSEAGRIGNVTFIEDSIATRGLAVEAALQATPAPIVWIAGGRSKGADVAELENVIRDKVRLFIGVGESGPELRETVGQWVASHLCSQKDGKTALRCAVRAALKHLEVHSPMGGTVLLAPLASSFDQFADYTDRARCFREVVREEELSWTLSS